MTTINKIKGLVNVQSLSELLFDVEKLKFTDCDANSEYKFDIFAYPNGQKLRVNSCSSRYELVQNSEVFPKIEQILMQNGIKFVADYGHVNHARFYVNYNIVDDRFKFCVDGTNDVCYPRISVHHSYNGLTKYRIVVGYYRLVCTNGLVIAVEDMSQYNLCITGKHTAEILKSFNKLDNIVKMFANTSNIMDQITAKYQRLASAGIELNDLSKVIEKVLEKSGINAIDNKTINTIQIIKTRIESELYNPDLGYTKLNNWLLYNGINSYLNDSSLNIAVPELRREKDQKVFEYLLQESELQLV